MTPSERFCTVITVWWTVRTVRASKWRCLPSRRSRGPSTVLLWKPTVKCSFAVKSSSPGQKFCYPQCKEHAEAKSMQRQRASTLLLLSAQQKKISRARKKNTVTHNRRKLALSRMQKKQITFAPTLTHAENSAVVFKSCPNITTITSCAWSASIHSLHNKKKCPIVFNRQSCGLGFEQHLQRERGD